MQAFPRTLFLDLVFSFLLKKKTLWCHHFQTRYVCVWCNYLLVLILILIGSIKSNSRLILKDFLKSVGNKWLVKVNASKTTKKTFPEELLVVSSRKATYCAIFSQFFTNMKWNNYIESIVYVSLLCHARQCFSLEVSGTYISLLFFHISTISATSGLLLCVYRF